MFKRQKKRPVLSSLREVVWPSMGWRRLVRYFHHRIVRLKATNVQIAIGLSNGAAISFVPLPGTHIIGAAGLSVFMRSSVLAGVLGTCVGTPWTLPVMWWAAYKVGAYSFSMLGQPVAAMPSVFEWHDLVYEIKEHPFALFVPWVCGGVILSLVTWPVFYVGFYRLIKWARHHKPARKMVLS